MKVYFMKCLSVIAVYVYLHIYDGNSFIFKCVVLIYQSLKWLPEKANSMKVVYFDPMRC